MAKKTERPELHPDDFMVVSVNLAFRAKLNPEVDDAPSFNVTAVEETRRAADAADYLEKVVSAIRERRLYGFMLQEQAESAIGAGHWIDKTTEKAIAENVTVRSQIIEMRRDD
jgi:hypothetical protein